MFNQIYTPAAVAEPTFLFDVYKKPKPTKNYTVISLDAGVQSSTLALMAAKGVVGPMPDAAVFADTGAEPESVYKWLDWLETQLPFPLYRVAKGDLTEDNVTIKTNRTTGRKYLNSLIPYYTKKENGKHGMLTRKCTRDYKIYPIQKFLKQHFDVKAARKVDKIKYIDESLGKTKGNYTYIYAYDLEIEQWIGISTDEAARMKPSEIEWIRNRHPLIEMDMSRADCILWMLENGYPTPPRSACVYCTYHSDDEWIRLYTNRVRYYLLQQDKVKSSLYELLGNKCIRCGFGDDRAFQVHHINRDGKADRQTSRNVMYFKKLLKIVESEKNKDIKTLELLCANCHVIEHYDDQRKHKEPPELVTKERRYSNSRRTKLNTQVVLDLRQRQSNGEVIDENAVAQELNVNIHSIQEVLKGRSWKWVTAPE